MSIYTALSSEVPIYALNEWIAAAPGVAVRGLQRDLAERANALQEASASIRGTWNENLSDTIAKTTQRMRGMLSQFLSTPLTSDSKEIQRILEDYVRQVVEQVLPSNPLGILGIASGRLLADPGNHASTKKIADAGKRFLAGGQTRKGKPADEVFESSLVFQGGLNFDVLNVSLSRSLLQRTSSDELTAHVIRKSLLMLKYRHGELLSGTDRHESFLVLDTRQLDIESILAATSTLANGWEGGHVSLWEDLARPEEFLLRLRSADRTGIRDAIDELLGSRFPAALTSRIKKTGKLIHKQLATGNGEPD